MPTQTVEQWFSGAQRFAQQMFRSVRAAALNAVEQI